MDSTLEKRHRMRKIIRPSILAQQKGVDASCGSVVASSDVIFQEVEER